VDWLTITILAVIISGLTILWLRIEKGVRAPAIIVVYFPAALLILKWSQFKETWSELGTAVLIGFAVFLTWWIPIGRNLPPPKGSQIIVITDDDEEE
jgi:hypothetical protein